MADRNSTESNDTGYTSGHGASPGCVIEDKSTKVQEFKLKFKDEHEMTTVRPPTPPSELSSRFRSGKSKPLTLGTSDKQQSLQLSQSSIASTSSDYIRFYVPLIFYKPVVKTERAGLMNRSSPIAGGSNLFSIQVCLVEDSEELIKVSLENTS